MIKFISRKALQETRLRPGTQPEDVISLSSEEGWVPSPSAQHPHNKPGVAAVSLIQCQGVRAGLAAQSSQISTFQVYWEIFWKISGEWLRTTKCWSPVSGLCMWACACARIHVFTHIQQEGLLLEHLLWCCGAVTRSLGMRHLVMPLFIAHDSLTF